MVQGERRVLCWPLQKFDERFICMTDCYKYKHQQDINRNFNNNLDIIIKMPLFHTDVFWDLGKDISLGSSFKVSQKDDAKGENENVFEAKKNEVKAGAKS